MSSTSSARSQGRQAASTPLFFHQRPTTRAPLPFFAFHFASRFPSKPLPVGCKRPTFHWYVAVAFAVFAGAALRYWPSYFLLIFLSAAAGNTPLTKANFAPRNRLASLLVFSLATTQQRPANPRRALRPSRPVLHPRRVQHNNKTTRERIALCWYVALPCPVRRRRGCSLFLPYSFFSVVFLLAAYFTQRP